MNPRSPVGPDEIAPWYAVGAAFVTLGLPAGGVGHLAALGAGAGVMAVGVAARPAISQIS